MTEREAILESENEQLRSELGAQQRDHELRLLAADDSLAEAIEWLHKLVKHCGKDTARSLGMPDDILACAMNWEDDDV